MPTPLPVLQCFPCPHASACCNNGVTLWEHEKNRIEAVHSGSVEWDEEEGAWVTAVVDGHCVFMVNNQCTIHGQPYYPQGCSEFPYAYQFPNLSICPSLKDSE